MFDLLFRKITEKVPLGVEEFRLCKPFFQPRRLRRRQFLLQEGDVCTHQAFVVKGLLRSYTVDDKKAVHILQFASEGWWMADLASYLTGEPSLFNMEALEDTELLLLSRPDWDSLLAAVPRLEPYFRILIQNHLVATQKRLMQSLSGTAEEKYQQFMRTYPDCLERVPRHMIASFIGVSRETLSRLSKYTGPS